MCEKTCRTKSTTQVYCRVVARAGVGFCFCAVPRSVPQSHQHHSNSQHSTTLYNTPQVQHIIIVITTHHNSLSDADDLRLPRDIDVINARGPPAFACPSAAAGGSRVAGSVLIGRKASSLGVPSGSLGRGDMRLGNAPIDCVCFGFGRESTDSPWYLNPPCSNDLRRSS